MSVRLVPRENIFPAPFDTSWFYKPVVRRLLDTLQSEGAEVFAIGGCVRDSFWDREVKEIDLAINIEPARVKELVNKIDCKVLNVGFEFGTLTVILGEDKFEITSMRKDIKTFGRSAKVEYTDNLVEDAKRRDFTFNTIYLSPNGFIIDPLGNFPDLRSGKVKFVGNPNIRIDEDYLRILRYFRFVSKFPNANKCSDQETLDAIKTKRSLILKLSKERIWNELKLILSSPSIDTSIFLMNKTGVLSEIFPKASLKEIEEMLRLEKLLKRIILDQNGLGHIGLCDPIRRLALLHVETKNTNQVVLSLDRKEKKRLRFYQSLGHNFSEEYCQIFGFKYGVQTGIDFLLLGIVKSKQYAILKSEKDITMVLKSCYKKILEGSVAEFPLSGKDLLKFGYCGKKLGQTLEELERIWIESGFSLNRQKLLENL